MRRITAEVKTRLTDLRRKDRDNEERAFLVHGTMADPRWIDASIEPSDRQPGTCYLGDPRIVNMSPIALGRYSSLRSWLSQRSEEHTSELQSLMRISYAVFCLKKKNKHKHKPNILIPTN